ncbi:4012_t:CDS:2 [Ambispora gerdemannii]|uniref:4012_t:CDS:1 n=1 Tax=Ambispora gerdemannii TaxID=144530 RepID=A0A9N9A9I2_9GLOM|nr:4012_t:CDS:2 [Ambispora gerdemannii]
MSQVKSPKKRKRTQIEKTITSRPTNNSKGNATNEESSITFSSSLNNQKPSHIVTPQKTGRKYTVSVAFPGSIIENAQSAELKTYLAGQIARALAIFNVDEVVIFNESKRDDSLSTTGKIGKNRKKGGEEDNNVSNDPNIFLARVLQYLETPHSHHFRQEEKSPYREGVVIEKLPKDGQGSLVDAGLTKHVKIDRSLKPGIQVTLDMGNYDVNKAHNNYIQAKVVSPKTPREESGLYWGYQIRLADSISKVFTECTYPDGYDVTIGTSERGNPIDQALEQIPEFSIGGKYAFTSQKSQIILLHTTNFYQDRHLLVVFGGLGGLEVAIDSDQDLTCTGEEADALFDLWVNTCPNQGSRTIRTEEAILISMACLRQTITEKGKKSI